MKNISTIAAVVLGVMLFLSGCASLPFARKYVTTEIIDGKETTLYHAVSQEYRFANKGLYSGQEYLGLRTILYEAVTHTTWYEGMDGIKSQIQVAASIVDRQGRAEKRLWVIHHHGHEFWQSHAYDQYVYIVERGCCDGPDRLTTFDATSGSLIGSRETRRGQESQR
jgi:hypothetical protein